MTASVPAARHPTLTAMCVSLCTTEMTNRTHSHRSIHSRSDIKTRDFKSGGKDASLHPKKQTPVLENQFTPTRREGISEIKRRSDRLPCQQGLITHRLSLADWRLSADYCNSEERLMCHFVGRAHPFKINCVTQLDHCPKRKKKGKYREKKMS